MLFDLIQTIGKVVAITPYVPLKTAMQFINDAVEKWQANRPVLYKQIKSHSTISSLDYFGNVGFACNLDTKPLQDRSVYLIGPAQKEVLITQLIYPFPPPSKNRTISSEILEIKNNFTCFPGSHTILSPVVGSRAAELTIVKQILKSETLLENLQKAIYIDKLIYLIPKSKKNEADIVARELFLNYISKYAIHGCTEQNIIEWSYRGLRCSLANLTSICEIENDYNTWNITAVVEARHGTYNEEYNCYLPPHVAAYHELMHVEETPPKSSKSILQENGVELLTSIKTFILLDTIYKKIHGIKKTTQVDYNKFININGTIIPLGRFANFYREQEIALGKLHLALISTQSIEFLKGKIK